MAFDWEHRVGEFKHSEQDQHYRASKQHFSRLSAIALSFLFSRRLEKGPVLQAAGSISEFTSSELTARIEGLASHDLRGMCWWKALWRDEV